MATRPALEELVHDFELVEDLAGRVPEEVVDRLRSMIEGGVRAARQSSVPGFGGRSRKLVRVRAVGDYREGFLTSSAIDVIGATLGSA